MKKINIFLLFLSFFALTFSACKDLEYRTDLDDIAEDGYYVLGEGVGIATIDDAQSYKTQMAIGVNEYLQDNGNTWNASKREGMYEKYIYIEADKAFYIAYRTGKTATLFGATLTAQDIPTDGDALPGYKGENLKENTAMKVSKSGFYHIIYDENLDDAFDASQITIVPVNWAISGGCNSWGYTPGTLVEGATNTTRTWKWTDLDFAANGEFKIKDAGNGSASVWKIILTETGTIKANQNLGADMVNGGDNIVIGDVAGLYEVTLTYNLAKGNIANSFTLTKRLTEASSTPTTMYMIGDAFGNWNWNDEGVVALTPVHGKTGEFWCIRYLTTTNNFKFCATKAWNGDFTTLDENIGLDDVWALQDGNCAVNADGVYMIHIDLINSKMTIEEAKVYGIGDCFGGWDQGMSTALFTNNDDGTVSFAVPNAGNLRMYAYSSISTSDWWTREFNIYGGKIVYRGDGGDQEEVSVAAGTTVSLDFNAGTGSITN